MTLIKNHMLERAGKSMSLRMKRVLQYLRDAKQQDWPFVDLPGVPKQTVKALTKRAWIYESPGIDGSVKYTITDSGERALHLFEKPLRSNPHKICPECGIRSKHVTASGRMEGYCIECQRVLSRRKWEHKATRFKSNTCPRCQKRERHQYPNGRIATYCEHCNRVTKRRNKRKNKQRKIEQARRGELICIRCKTNPRHFTDKSVYDYCRDCLRQYMNEYNDRRRPNSQVARSREP